MKARRKRDIPETALTRINPDELPATVLADEVDVTHTLVLTHPPGWSNTSIILDSHLFIVVERGALRANFDSEHVVMQAGTVCLLPVGCERQLRAVSAVPTQTWRLRFNVIRNGTYIGLNCPPIFKSDASSLLSHQQLLSEVHENSRYAAELTPLLSAFISRFLTLPELSDEQNRRLDGSQRRRVERLVKRGLMDGVTPGDMALEAGLSPDYFTRLFKATYGIPPRTYLLQKRMELAGDLLRDSTMSVKEVCNELGEPDMGTFCRLFKRVMGQTPTQFRKL